MSEFNVVEFKVRDSQDPGVLNWQPYQQPPVSLVRPNAECDGMEAEEATPGKRGRTSPTGPSAPLPPAAERRGRGLTAAESVGTTHWLAASLDLQLPHPGVSPFAVQIFRRRDALLLREPRNVQLNRIPPSRNDAFQSFGTAASKTEVKAESSCMESDTAVMASMMMPRRLMMISVVRGPHRWMNNDRWMKRNGRPNNHWRMVAPRIVAIVVATVVTTVMMTVMPRLVHSLVAVMPMVLAAVTLGHHGPSSQGNGGQCDDDESGRLLHDKSPLTWSDAVFLASSARPCPGIRRPCAKA